MRLDQRPEVLASVAQMISTRMLGRAWVMSTCPVPRQNGARPRWEVTVDRAGHRQGARGVGVPAADAGETGQGALVFAVAASPGVDQRRRGYQVAFVVVA